MSEESLVQQPTATWNTVRGVWEKAGMANLLCEHWALFSEAWPTSGMMRNGLVYELPMQERLTVGSEFSLLPQNEILRTPTASQGEGGALGEAEARKRGNTVGIRDQAMDLARAQGLKVSREIQNLPTPAVNDMGRGKTVEAWDEWTEKMKSKHGNGNGHGPSLDIEVLRLLPTVTTQDGKNNGGPSQFDRNTKPLNTQVMDFADWGKFEPAIRRWEQTLGIPAPAPTKPDGKEGAHRLSSEFTEWMMGLEPGWITDCGLTRNEELKAAGNGVVPQQAELALRTLLAGMV